MRGYQNITIDGKDIGVRKRRAHSKFYNEGKWNNFIAPFLPVDCSGMTFLDLGCNLGMFLKLAKGKGFSKVIGVEADPYCCMMAKEYENDAQIFNTKITGDSVFPEADVTLMANVHYHMPSEDLAKFLKNLKTKYLIVVSAENAKNRDLGRRGSTRHTRKDFRGWKELKYIGGIPYEDDEFPRRMFSILYENKV